jgi:hypothetical protein
MPIDPTQLSVSPNKSALVARLALIDPRKVKAYRAHRTPDRNNPRTKYFYDYTTFRRSPLMPVAPPAADFVWPKKYEGERFDHHQTLEWEEEGFTLRARVKDDSEYQLDYLGEIWENTRGSTSPPRGVHRDALPFERDREGVPGYWFRPELDVDAEYAAHRKDKGKHEARLRARHSLLWDFERIKSFQVHWWACGVEVTAYRDGIELGSNAIWGIETDAGDYLVETAHDLAGEAIEQANDALERLTLSQAKKDGLILTTYRVALKKGTAIMTTPEGELLVMGAGTDCFLTVLKHAKTFVEVLIVNGEEKPWIAKFSTRTWETFIKFFTRYSKEHHDQGGERTV